ncbi:MAG: DUF4348 domain-containing protein [Phycisphaerae bacterium]|nr:DUF4348 domain-containing protein [Saprospiraceae bacterium]
MDQRLLILIFCFPACNLTPSEQKASRTDVIDSTSRIISNSNFNPREEDTITPKFDNLFSFLKSEHSPIDSEYISRFSGSWYAYTFQDTYKGFQQFGVVFPFQYVIEDSLGSGKTVYFNSIGEMAAWRQTQNPPLNAWELDHFGSSRRVVWEGYPHLLFGDEKGFNIPYDLDSNQAIVTYLFPMNKVDYYFRKTEDIWQVFKRVQKKYSSHDLKLLTEETFEGFTLRFISDTPFRMRRIKWPLKNTDEMVGNDLPTVTFLNKEDSHLKNPWDDALIMTVYQGSQKDWPEKEIMYFRSKDEGGVCYGYIFNKIKNNWALTEIWDASN